MTTETAAPACDKEGCPCAQRSEPPLNALVHCRICGEITRQEFTRTFNVDFGPICMDTMDIYNIEDDLKLKGASDSEIIRAIAEYENNVLGPPVFDCRRTNTSTSRYL